MRYTQCTPVLAQTSAKAAIHGGVAVEFHERLKEARLKAGLTQKQVAEAMNISESHFQAYEHGRREPLVSTAARLARTLHVSLDWLTGLSNDGNSER